MKQMCLTWWGTECQVTVKTAVLLFQGHTYLSTVVFLVKNILVLHSVQCMKQIDTYRPGTLQKVGAND